MSDARGKGGPAPAAPELHWTLPTWALEASYAEMAADGKLDREGIALWAGRADDDGLEAVVTHVVLLRGPGVYRARGVIRIAPEVLNEVTDRLAELGDGIYLVGQVHGHPPLASTDLSYTDVAYGIRTPRYLSVVAPDYGTRGHDCLRDCGVHVFDAGAGWRRMEPEEAGRRIAVRREAAPPEGVLTVEANTVAGEWDDA